MSKNIKGITIEIGGDTQKLNKALEGVNKQSREIQGELKQVERLLKLDPSNTTLLAQKQKLLTDAIQNTSNKLETLKEAQRQVQQQFERGEVGEEQYRAIQREVISTENNLNSLISTQNRMNGVLSESEIALQEERRALEEQRRAQEESAKSSGELANKIQTTEQKLELEQRELERNTAALGENAREQDKLNLKRESLTRQVELQREKVQLLTTQLDNLTNAEEQNESAILEARTALVQAERQLNEYNTELRETETQLGRLNNSFIQSSESLNKFGEKAVETGKSLTAKVTAPVVALGGLATKSAVEFESAFAGVIKTVDATDQQLDKLEKGIRDMSKEIPASAVAIAGVSEAAGQLGIETDNILGFTRVMIDLGEATNLSADQAATSFAKFANITQMSQQDFDKLGSVVVDLGNNLATTEADIVSMGMRLAGAGSQIGLTEAQIMSLGGALSSVGIEAEAGGSAFSKVMIEMQLATETGLEAMRELEQRAISSGISIEGLQSAVRNGGSELKAVAGAMGMTNKELRSAYDDAAKAKGSLEDFANVAGMSGEQFTKAFKEDATGAIIAFIQGLADAENQGVSAIKILDDMDIKEVRLRDSLLRAAGASEVFAGAIELGNKAWEENTALTKEAEQRYKTSESQMATLKNTLNDLAITFGEIILPVVISLTEKVKGLLEWINNLSPEMQKTIVVIAGLAAAIGPLLIFIGKISIGISSIMGLVAKLTPIITGATAATGGFSAVIAALTGPIGWVIAGIAALTVAGIGLYKHFKQDSIPAVQLFGDEVSDTTQKAVGSFLDLEENATLALNQLAWSGQTVTDEMKENITANFSEMKNQVVEKLQEQKTEATTSLNEMLANSKTITEEEKAEMIRITTERYDEQIAKTEEGNTRILEILNQAKEDNRAITDEERNEINAIKEEMTETAVRVLSESEAEQLAIMERLKQESGKISALQAAEVVQNSLEQKEKSIEQAESEYQERLKYAAQLRSQGTKEAIQMADKIASEAKRQRDEAVKEATAMHNNIVFEAQQQAKEHVNQVDWETGEVLSKWQVLKRDSVKTFSEMWKGIQDTVSNAWSALSSAFSELWDSISTWFVDLATTAITWGENIVQGLWDGISGTASWLGEKVSEFAGGIATAFKDFFGIRSPSRLMALYGQYITEGLAEGIDKNSKKPVDSTKRLMDSISNALKEVQSFVVSTSGIIEKEFELWKLRNQELQGSSEELSGQLEMQKQKHGLLTEQIKVTESALSTAIQKYGEGSIIALEYKNALLDLQIEHEKLTGSINETSDAMKDLQKLQSSMTMHEKTDRAKGVNSLVEKGIITKEFWDEYNLLDYIGGGEAKPSSNKSNNVTQNITINSPSPLNPSEVARQTKKASQQLALGF